jgi:hypothetical protein
MKTIVLGLFDELDDARQVLGELAGSPLDLDAIELVCEDVATQHALAAEIGLPARRGISAGLLLGAITGGVAGYFGGTTALAALGPLLGTAAGTLLGSAAGSALGAVSETTRVPPVHRSEMEAALAEGATAIIVRTDNLPTARAIGDLFQMGGSRNLSPLPEDETNGQVAASDTIDELRFAPPGVESESAPGTADLASSTDTGRTQPQEPAPAMPPAPIADSPPTPAESATGETLFAPPWRRGGGAQAPVPAPDPTPGQTAAPDPWARTTQPETDSPSEAQPATQPAQQPTSSVEPADPESTGPAAPIVSPEPIAPASPLHASPAAPDTPAAPSSDERTAPARLPADTPVDALGLSSRVSGALHRAGIENLADLRAHASSGEAGLAELPGIGPVAVSVILNRMHQIDGPPEAPGTGGAERRAMEAASAPRLGAPATGASPSKATPRPVAPRRQRVNARDLLLEAVRGALDEGESEPRRKPRTGTSAKPKAKS